MHQGAYIVYSISQSTLFHTEVLYCGRCEHSAWRVLAQNIKDRGLFQGTFALQEVR